MNKYLALWLEAPLQSWGMDSKFYNRGTGGFPSRSAILGIIFAAMGARGEQRELLARFYGLSQTIFAFGREKKAVQLRDFHTVGSYSARSLWENFMMLKQSDGKAPNTKGGKLTYRYYLQDVAFGVVFELPSGLENEVAASMQNPVYDIYLGRKCCPPSDFIFHGMLDTADEARNIITELAKVKEYRERFTVFSSAVDGGEKFTLNDEPICFGERKEYKMRHVYKVGG